MWVFSDISEAQIILSTGALDAVRRVPAQAQIEARDEEVKGSCSGINTQTSKRLRSIPQPFRYSLIQNGIKPFFSHPHAPF
jgi:hypothetical protein